MGNKFDWSWSESFDPRQSVLIVMGSHRRYENTDYLTNKISTALKGEGYSTTILNVNDVKIEHCTDCGYCHQNYGRCVFRDDMPPIYEALKYFRKIIILSPVYYNNVTSRLKTIVDRCQMIFICDFEHKKPFAQIDQKGVGILISLGGVRDYENQFLGNELTMKLFYRNLRIPLKTHITFKGTDHDHLKNREEEVHRAIVEIIKEVKDYDEI